MLARTAGSATDDQRPLLIVLSHLRWDFVFQRPQHLLTRASQYFDVVFVEEPLFEGNWPTSRELQRGNNVKVVQPLLPPGTGPSQTLMHQGDVVEALARTARGRQIYVWYYTPMAMAFGHRIDADLVIFDKMDELSAFAFASSELRAFESALLERADVVFTGGASLHAAAAHRHNNIHCFPSSIDTAHFASARAKASADPVDQAHLTEPRLGYFGVIDERLDLDLVAAMARLRPNWQIVMVGPVAKIDPATLPKARNLHWLGPKAYAELPLYMAHWDMGWMPFALNDATRFISPTKTPEFLAAGLPLLSTPIHDVVEPYGRLGLVEIATHADALAAAGDALLDAEQVPASKAARLARVDRQLATGCWDKTWAAMYAQIRRAATTPATIVRREIQLV